MNSLVIPAYNEEKRIERTVKSLLRLSGFELIFVVRGRDKTYEILSKYKTKIKIMRFDVKGKWAAIIYGLSKARGNYAGFVDADLPITLDNLRDGFKVAKKADLVISSRVNAKRDFKRLVLSRLFNLYTKILFQLPYNDTQCGFKVLNKKAMKLLPLIKGGGWETDVELLCRARKDGLKIFELPVNWREVKGSKLRFKSILSMFFNLLKLRFQLWLSRT